MEGPLEQFLEPLSLLTSELTEITGRIHALQSSHSARIQAAAALLKDHLQQQTTGELRQGLDCEFQEATRIVRARFNERMRSAADEWAVEKQSLLNEIAELRRTADRRGLSTEIAQTEETLVQVRQNIESMINDARIEISKLVRISAREAELQAYLKGLNFKAGALESAAGFETEGTETKFDSTGVAAEFVLDAT
jgi:hypothetical protein